MLSASTWVPRGYAAEFPEKYELDDEEMERITAMAKLQLGDNAHEEDEDQEDTHKAQALKEDIEIDDDLKAYDLENYDNDEESEGEDVTMLPGLSGTSAKYHEGEDGQDPYLSLPTQEETEEDKKELQVFPSDNLVLATRTEDEVSYLDVYVYDDGAGNIGPDDIVDDPELQKGYMRESSLYVHHDLMLPAFPLTVEWINYRPGSDSEDNIGNFAAIGTFDPQIEVWNLDCVDKAFPDLILGEPEPASVPTVKKSKNKKKKKSKSQHVTTHHTDAVLSLSHNKIHRNVLASTSADNTVKLWDLNTGVAVRSFDSIHSKKTVSSSQWHPTESSILLTGGYDGTCGITDVRLSDESEMTKSFKVSSSEEVEAVKWGISPEVFYCGTDRGNVYCFDVRRPEQPLWTLHAHDAGISSLEVNYYLPGMLATSAMGEKVVKFWKYPVDSESKKGPSMILSRDFGVGNVLSTSFSNDIEVAGNIVVGGAAVGLKMWDCLNNRSIRSSFKSELKDLQKRAREESAKLNKVSRVASKYQGEENYNDNVITIDPDSSESEDEDEELEDEA
ncbi:rRNA-processing protein [Yamadazyma tenuis]|uniref:Periodic tryptophan protein 1 n=1 Tax=Candida tenuis (strain ATCC 10573 / BCRC 21748 / CBS 615 / JCM 9827 / NBRC 10315 / NRRL Y-1498 / VKM Y-70) TaxID=590646 RepID=G3B8R1_CANTC|nr:periodic tryptophan protein 1 [Yamadazyma tenuis ATCC 10573]EGV62409.1 periodic tryptophan protein 1 [Yamadazyma tenuis ATCC 10573]WEJ93683.1 rRNA-processing protein [Yamadazyma tenuis]